MPSLPAPKFLVREVIDSWYDFNPAEYAPEGYEVLSVTYLDRAEDAYLKRHEFIARITFKPLPPPIEYDTAPLTHRMRLAA